MFWLACDVWTWKMRPSGEPKSIAGNALTYAHFFAHTQPLRRQRGAYVGFDDCHIRGTDRAISVHVFTEIRATDRHAHLQFGQGNIGGVDDGVSVYITNKHAH